MKKIPAFATAVVLSFAALVLPLGLFPADAQDGPRRSPFRFAQDRRADLAKSLTLEMTLISDSKAVAVFNGKAYSVGDSPGGYLITRIDPGAVKARKGSRLKIFTITGTNR